LSLRPMTASDDDCHLVARWRNTDQARSAFYNHDVVTPDTHKLFMEFRRMNDLVFMIEIANWGWTQILVPLALHHVDQDEPWHPVGMLSLDVNVKDHTAECGRLFIDPEYQGKGLGFEADVLQLSYAFDYLNLRSVWGEIYTDNERRLHVAQETGWTLGDEVPNHPGVKRVDYIKETWLAKREELFGRLS
jgi:RimJ/RimL family protein N-acetyltransferase